MTVWQIDFKDVIIVAPDPDGKQQHVVKVLNTIDVGTSLLIDAHARADFTAETALRAVATTLEQHGLPEQVRLDRGPRGVGSQQQRDVPSPIVRFLRCLGVQVTICPPHRSDKNGVVERYHRTFAEECLPVYRPTDLDQVRTLTAPFQQYYNEERPHQGEACANHPPRVAFPDLPRRPWVPAHIDPDRWLVGVHDGHCFARRVGRDGRIQGDR